MSASSKRAVSLPVESSWRMVDGEHDSFETSVVPPDEEEDPFLSSGQPSQGSSSSSNGSLGRGLSFRMPRGGGQPGLPGDASSSSQEDPGSIGGSQQSQLSQQDSSDLHAFLRRAASEDEARVLLRSPFQPSVPSSARQSPLTNSSSRHTTANDSLLWRQQQQRQRLGRTSYRTPEPQFRYPKVDVDPAYATVHDSPSRGQDDNDDDNDDDDDDSNNVFSKYRFFGANKNGSPLPRRQPKTKGRAGEPQEDGGAPGSSTARPAWKNYNCGPSWKRALVVGATVLVPAVGILARHPLLPSSSSSSTPRVAAVALQSSYAAAAAVLAPVCRLPAVSQLELGLCSWANESAAAAAGQETARPCPQSTPRRRPSTFWGRAENAATTATTTTTTTTTSLLQDASDLMRVQVQLGTLAHDRVLTSRRGGARAEGAQDTPQETLAVPPAHDAWRAPRDRTKNMRHVLQRRRAEAYWAAKRKKGKKGADPDEDGGQRDGGQRDALLLRELDTYLEATQQVAMALAKFQTGAAAVAPETLAHSSRGMLVQLQRMVRKSGGGGGGGGGGRPGLDSFAPLQETYRRQTDTLVKKAADRVQEARAVLAQLDTAGLHLDSLQRIVAARKDAEDASHDASASEDAARQGPPAPPGPPPQGVLAWLWRVLLGRPGLAHERQTATQQARQAVRQWDDHAAQLRVLRLRQDDAVRRMAGVLEELKGIYASLRDLQARFGGGGDQKKKSHNKSKATTGTSPGDVDVRRHMEIIQAGVQDLVANSRR